jgi:hypothetical protein
MRTPDLQGHCLTAATLVMGLAILSGCATPPRPEQMATPPVAHVSASLLGKVAIAGVTGGKETNPTLFSEVGNKELSEALRLSLQQAGYLSPAPDVAPITVKVGVVGVDKPAGYTLTVTTLIRYVVANKEGGKPLFDELITASCTRGVADDWYGQTRIKHTEECAVRNNIASFLTKLGAADIP